MKYQDFLINLTNSAESIDEYTPVIVEYDSNRIIGSILVKNGDRDFPKKMLEQTELFSIKRDGDTQSLYEAVMEDGEDFVLELLFNYGKDDFDVYQLLVTNLINAGDRLVIVANEPRLINAVRPVDEVEPSEENKDDGDDRCAAQENFLTVGDIFDEIYRFASGIGVIIDGYRNTHDMHAVLGRRGEKDDTSDTVKKNIENHSIAINCHLSPDNKVTIESDIDGKKKKETYDSVRKGMSALKELNELLGD